MLSRSQIERENLSVNDVVFERVSQPAVIRRQRLEVGGRNLVKRGVGRREDGIWTWTK